MIVARLLRVTLRLAGILLLVLLIALAGFRAAAMFRETDETLPKTSRLVPTPLGAVAVQESGPAEGPPILLIPGTAGWSDFWRDISAHLAARGWRVIAVDLPPFGYSEHDPQARYDRAAQAERLAAVLRAQRRPAVVVGHSFGGGPAAELALRSPELLSRLVLVDAALGELDPVSADPGLLGSALAQGWIAQPVTSATMTNPWLTGTMLRSMLARQEAAAPWVDTIGAPMRRRGTTSAYAAWLPALFAVDDGALSRRSDNLRRIAVPVDLIWGEADAVTPVAQGERIAQLTRPRSFARLPGLGHIPHIEDRDAFLAALDAAIGGEE